MRHPISTRGVAGIAVGTALMTATTGCSSRPTLDPTSESVATADATAAGTNDRLRRFEDCDQLRDWYVRAALARVGPWGLDEPGLGMVDTPVDPANGPASAVTGPRSPLIEGGAVTGAADLAATDGQLVARVVDGALVLTDVTGDRAREESRTNLPGRLARPEVVFAGDEVLVVGTVRPRFLVRGGAVPGPGVDGRSFLPSFQGGPRTLLVRVDVTDPTAPVVGPTLSIPGRSLTTRRSTDGTVHVLVATDHPDLRFTSPDGGLGDLPMPGPGNEPDKRPGNGPGKGRSVDEALAYNRRVIAKAPASAWLPRVSTPDGERATPACSDVLHPAAPSGLGTLTVLSLDGDALDSTTVAAPVGAVRLSADRLHLTTSAPGAAGGPADGPGAGPTVVHAFALAGTRTSYVDSTSLVGTVAGPDALDVDQGRLRVVTALGDPGQPDDHAVTVLAEKDGNLVTTGRLDGIAAAGVARSVSWSATHLLLTADGGPGTLVVIDLTEPDRPRVSGRLRSAGWSSLLVPLGDGLALGLGRGPHGAADRVGAATFDVSDPSGTKRVDTLGLGSSAVLGADTDERAATYLPESRTLVTTVAGPGTDGSRFVALNVAEDGALHRAGAWPARGYAGASGRALPLGGDRVAIVDDEVRVVTVG